jgi:hypothetical protein
VNEALYQLSYARLYELRPEADQPLAESGQIQ